MVPNIKRLALSLGLTLGLGIAFVPQGCGGVTPAAEVPEDVARQLRGCALVHRDHLGPVGHSVSFDVKLKSDGKVDKVALLDSTLADEELEKCMAIAIKQLTEDDLPLRRSEVRDGDPGAPESRMLVGHPEALGACLVSAPCLLTLGFLMGAAYITVTLYVQATSKPQPPPAKPHVEESQKKDPKPEGDPKTTGTTRPIPPERPKRVPRCEEVFEDVVNCFYIQQPKYPTREKARDAVSKDLEKGPPKLPFTAHRTERSKEGGKKKMSHTTYKSADGKVKITIGCYELCCKNTNDGPVLVEGTQCYEHNTEDYR